MARLAGIQFVEKQLSPDDPEVKAELLLISSSILTPKLEMNGMTIWDTLAIGETLNELVPDAQLLPDAPKARAHCRSICGEMHSGFVSLRAALPMNIKCHMTNFKIWSRAQADIDRIVAIWDECLTKYGGPYLFGKKPCMADAMYAPVVTRFRTYNVKLPPKCDRFCETILALPEMKEWVDAALEEPDELEEFEAEF